jgi:hypothetical protein
VMSPERQDSRLGLALAELSPDVVCSDVGFSCNVWEFRMLNYVK